MPAPDTAGDTPDAALARVAARYAVAITPTMDELIDPQDPRDPIALQFRPDERELRLLPDELEDPIGDDPHAPLKGIVHRYPDRCLLKIVHVCPVYCRFCFRRERVGPDGEGALAGEELEQAFAYIAGQPAIWEVVLTGGDPFLLSPRRVREVTQRLAAIEHVKIVRWHTRVPVVEPQRVTSELAAALRADGLATWVVLHSNHARELTPAARAALARLADAGVPLLAQTVLLKDVNDSPEALEALMRALVEARVKPYYLHHLDKARGTAHFRVPVARGQELARELHGRASGIAQPQYVLDIPGGFGKAVLAAPAVREVPGGHEVRGRDGRWHAYPAD